MGALFVIGILIVMLYALGTNGSAGRVTKKNCTLTPRTRDEEPGAGPKSPDTKEKEKC